MRSDLRASVMDIARQRRKDLKILGTTRQLSRWLDRSQDDETIFCETTSRGSVLANSLKAFSRNWEYSKLLGIPNSNIIGIALEFYKIVILGGRFAIETYFNRLLIKISKFWNDARNVDVRNQIFPIYIYIYLIY